ncbi:MAG: sigma-E factor negative regulatory protein [Gammaproteobacteria bacterium]
MMERNADKVSLLVDGELDECDMPCIVQAMKTDELAGERWRNYHLIRDTLQGNLPAHLPRDLAGRVALALEHEPIHFNPRQHLPATASIRTPSHRTRATVGFALAASLSAIAVFGVGVMELNDTSHNPAGPVIASARAVAVAQDPMMDVNVTRTPPSAAVQLAAAPAVRAKQQSTVTVLAAAKPAAQVPARRSTVAVSEDASPATTDLYDYLVNSHRYAPGAADTQAMLSYVQLVGYGSGN